MELKKEAFEAAKPSIIGLVVLTLFKMGIVILMPDSAIAVLSGLPCDLVFLALVLFAGYRATKTLGHGINAAVGAGALAALVQAVVWMVVMLIWITVSYQTGQARVSSVLWSALGPGLTLAAVLVMAFVFSAAIGFASVLVNGVVGAVGGFIGQKLK